MNHLTKYARGPANNFYRGGGSVDPRREQARYAVRKAIQEGRLIVTGCEVCGFQGKNSDGKRAVEAHHESYLPKDFLKVKFLCRSHHFEADKVLWEAGK